MKNTGLWTETADLAEPAAPTPAVLYERFAVPAVFAPAAERLLAAARPATGERVLDVGTGTGIVARFAARQVGRAGAVTGLDPDSAMLNVARAAAEQEGLPITWTLGSAERLPFPDSSFDLVLSQYALMFSNDLPAALKEMRRVLAPGGRVAFVVFQGIDRHPLYHALDNAVARHLGQRAIATIFALGDGNALAAVLAEAGFRDVTIESRSWTVRLGSPETFLEGEFMLDRAAVPAMQGLSADAARDLIAAIAPEMEKPLRTATRDGEVEIEFRDSIAQASR